MKTIQVYSLLLFIAIITCSCSKDDDNNKNCEEKNVTYSGVVQPILEQNCYSCHNNTISSGYLNLESFDQVKSEAINGWLYNTIAHTSGYPPMPENAEKLDSCSIKYIKIWIDSGTKQD